MKILIATPVSEEKKALFQTDEAEIIYKKREIVTSEDLKDVDAVLGNIPYDLINENPSVQWLQLDSAGIGNASELREGIILTNASGAYGEAISEHMLAETLAILKNLYRYYDQQKEHSWMNLGSVKTISNCVVLCIGMGDIGSSYAKKMHALGASVYGIRRTNHPKADYVEKQGTMDDLDAYLPEADVVALSLPETKETYHVINAERLQKMKAGAVLINVGRGSAIDESALRKAMLNHKLAGAALDVTEQEPLPKNNPLWNTPGVYITPHISGRFNAEVTYDKVLDIFARNLQHFIHHEPLEHVVDIKRGY